MKMNSIIFYTALLIVICCTECKNENEDIIIKNDEKEITVKNDSNKFHVNIVLYNQPLDTIQKYIHGKWKLAYGKGGVCTTTMYYSDNCYIEFTSDNNVITNSLAKINKASPIVWIKDFDLYPNDSTYLMTFKDDHDFTKVYAIDRIYNDTLIYHDNLCDAIYYHYLKSN